MGLLLNLNEYDESLSAFACHTATILKVMLWPDIDCQSSTSYNYNLLPPKIQLCYVACPKAPRSPMPEREPLWETILFRNIRTIEDLKVTDNFRMSGEEDYKNITMFLNRKRMNFYFDVEELVHVNFNLEISLYNLILPITSTVTVLLVNSLVLLMLKMKEKTLVDRMVLLDCLGNISTVGVMFVTFPIRVWGNSYLCLLITFFRGFITILNRLTNSCLHHRRERS